MALDPDICRQAIDMRRETPPRSWNSIARQLGVNATTLRYNVDPEFKERMRAAQRKRSGGDGSAPKRSPWRDGVPSMNRKGPAKKTGPRSGAKPGSPNPPANEQERQARAEALIGSDLATAIEARVAERVGPMKQIKRG